MKAAGRVPLIELAQKPRPQRPGLLTPGVRGGRSIAAIHQPPARSPGRWDQSPHVAAAVTIAIIGRATDEDAWTTPAAVPCTVPTVTAPGGGGSRRQRGRTQRCRGNCNEREFA